MGNHYHIDLEKYSLQRFLMDLKTREMIPSRRMLKEQLDERFKILENFGISNLKELIGTLNTRTKIALFSKETGLPV